MSFNEGIKNYSKIEGIRKHPIVYVKASKWAYAIAKWFHLHGRESR
jgi:hypothetical protein